MKAWLTYALIALFVGAAAHLGAVIAAPHLIMQTAMQRIGGGAVNQWRHAPRTSETSRAIVRPSPDLAYSSCVYDLSNGPLTITMTSSAEYWSLSLFADNSDNYFTRNDAQSPSGVRIVLVRAGAHAPAGNGEVVESPSVRGIALQRRLAPSAEAFAAADGVRRGDQCTARAVTN